MAYTKFKRNLGNRKCVDCKVVFVYRSYNHVRCSKCAVIYTNAPKSKDVLVMDSSIYPKRTWGKKRPDTISRSTLYRRTKIKNMYW